MPQTSPSVNAASPWAPSPTGVGASPPALCFPGSPGEKENLSLKFRHCLSHGRSPWGWESLEARGSPTLLHLPNQIPSKVPSTPPANPSHPLKTSQHTILGEPGMCHLPWISLGVTSPPISAGLGETQWSLAGPLSHLSPVKCLHLVLVYNHIGTFFLLNKGSSHRNGLPCLWIPF